LSDALEHVGLTGRQTSDDAAVQSLNTFLRRLPGLDEQFSIGRLTVVDGPIRDKMLTAYVRYSELRKLANKPEVATQAGFGEFTRQMNDTSNDLDVLLAELVDLAEKRLSPSRPMLAKRPRVKVASNKARQKAQKQRRLRLPRGQAAGTDEPDPPPAAESEPAPAAEPEEREVEVDGESGKARISSQLIKGAQS
jgi:hypothetical protein